MKYDWNINKIKEAVSSSLSFCEVLRKLNIPIQGNNSSTLKEILNKYNIDYSHFTGRAKEYNRKNIDINEYLSNNISIKSGKLKEKLFKLGLKENKCEICGISKWNGMPIVCQIHHIDGNNKNNNIENIQILCPNCHSQTENYRKDINNQYNKSEKRYCKICGKEITKNASMCSNCMHTNRRKVERPSKEQLLDDWREYKNMTKISIKYGVSDSAVRKWFKYYSLPHDKKTLINFGY